MKTTSQTSSPTQRYHTSPRPSLLAHCATQICRCHPQPRLARRSPPRKPRELHSARRSPRIFCAFPGNCNETPYSASFTTSQRPIPTLPHSEQSIQHALGGISIGGRVNPKTAHPLQPSSNDNNGTVDETVSGPSNIQALKPQHLPYSSCPGCSSQHL